MAEKSLKIRGVEWHYATGGRGEQTLLLFHGALGGAETMHGLAAAFEEEYRTVVPTVADVSTLGEVCDAASAILDREHVGRAVVFGGSFGGMLAQAFFQRRRAQVQDLVLLTTNAPSPAAAAHTARTALFARLFPFRLTRALMRVEVSRQLDAPAPAIYAARVAEFREQLANYFDHTLTKRTLLSRVALNVDFNRNERYAPEAHEDWPGRVLIVESGDDPAHTPAERRRLREAYPRAFVCTFPEGGHLLPLLRLEELVGLVKAFLKEDFSTPDEIFGECSAAEGHEHLPQAGSR